MKVISYRSDNGTRTGLQVGEGRKFIKLLLMDNPLKITKVPLQYGRYITEIEGYNLGRAKRIFKRAAKNFHGGMRGCSQGVREALR